MSELRFETRKIRTADKGDEAGFPDLLGQLRKKSSRKFDLDEEDAIFEGYGTIDSAYPYRQYNAYTRELQETDVKTAVLENDHIKAVFLPEFGGRLWELWEKETGKNLLYTNDVIRMSNLAVRNAWFSGGVEWNMGIIGHNPLTTDPLYVAETETSEGDPVLRMYEFERIRKAIWQMDFWIEKDGRVLNCRMRIVNDSADVIPMYWWSNMAVPEYQNGRLIVPAKKAITQKKDTVVKVEVPMDEGVDITDYQKIEKCRDYFFLIPKDEPKYIANVDAEGFGLLQISTDQLQGRKLFSWGNSDGADHWQEYLTDKAGRYVEIQGGLGKTQYGCIPMPPHTAWEWMEQYGPVQVPVEDMAASADERSAHLTAKIRLEQRVQQLEKILCATKEMGKKPADPIQTGSGYGALYAQSDRTAHLKFVMETESLKHWKSFFETGILHCPDPFAKPDEFLVDAQNLAFMEEHAKKENRENWYAHYQLGVGYYMTGQKKKAKKEFEESNRIAPNPWAYHGLACVFLGNEKPEKAAKAICKGIEMKRQDISYLKEAFEILSLAGAYEVLLREYKLLGKTEKNCSRLKVDAIRALAATGKNRKAFYRLNKDGGFELEDIREGANDVSELWEQLSETIKGKKDNAPHIYNYKVN